MQVSAISFEECFASGQTDKGEAVYVNIFEACGTEGCRLDCPAWKTAFALQFATDKSINVKKELRAFAKAQRRRLGMNTSNLDADDGAGIPRGSFKLADLQASSQDGCRSCQFLITLLTAILPAQTHGRIEDLNLEWIGYFSFHLDIADTEASRPRSIQLFCPTVLGTFVRGMHYSRPLLGDLSSTSVINKAQEWITECEVSHASCGAGRNVALPTRLISLQSLDMDDLHNSGVKLAVTAGMEGTYACLSHCWGKDPMPVRTTSDTFDEYTDLIAWKKLPKTFQDAILITRRLGLLYLWIDSICIIQDSIDDWQIESGRMASIYHDSFMTIAAASSSDFTGGCFSPNATRDTCFRVKLQGFNDIFVGVRDTTFQMRRLDQLADHLPLLTRAWCYQERLLSRRVLYWTHGELELECGKRRICECGNTQMAPHPMIAPAGIWAAKREYAGVIESVDRGKGFHSRAMLNRQWQRLVMQYTRLQLTRSSDKLPAMSGCAKEFIGMTGYGYLAGLWREAFADGLLWTVNPPVDQRRPAERRAPSWSWASVDTSAGVTYTLAESQSAGRQSFHDRIVALECTADGKDTTGAVRSGLLQIRSRVFPAHLRRICKGCRTQTTTYMLNLKRYQRKPRPGWETCKFKVPGLELGNASHNLSADFLYDRQKDFNYVSAEGDGLCQIAPISLLHIYDRKVGRTGQDDSVTDFFLVLRPAPEFPDSATYERVALATINFDNDGERQAWFQDVFDPEATEERLVTIR